MKIRGSDSFPPQEVPILTLRSMGDIAFSYRITECPEIDGPSARVTYCPNTAFMAMKFYQDLSRGRHHVLARHPPRSVA